MFYIKMILIKNGFQYFARFKSNIKINSKRYGVAGSELREILTQKLSKQKEKIQKFRKTHGSVVVSDVTVNSLYDGMRGTKALICETSEFDPEGIRFRGYSIPECKKLLPKAKSGNEPLPEGMFWLLLTGDIPTDNQVSDLSIDWANRAALPTHVVTIIENFPKTLHPMTQFSSAITALSSDSSFAKAYTQGKAKKSNYWEFVYEDAMDLIAKLPVIAAKIYRNKYKSDKGSDVVDTKKDWSSNLITMMGFDNPEFVEFMRMFLTIHSDECGSISSHVIHLVGSALSDPYLAFSAGMNGLAGPLHGRDNQEVLEFLHKILTDLGSDVTEEQLKEFTKKMLKSGRVIPGYGHVFLSVTDPRYTCLKEFALQFLPDDKLVKLTAKLFNVVPGVLKETGKVQNPWPNVDAHSGVILKYYGIEEMEFYTVIFGVSRALGAMASLVWSRGLGFPLERPKSISTHNLMLLLNAT